MLNLVCFPHYTCGGLLTDILNKTYSDVSPNGGINSIHHSLGKIGDANDILVDFDANEFYRRFNKLQVASGTWIGTHCWPGNLNLAQFNKVIVVTTATSRSRIYRWARAYNLYYNKTWGDIGGLELIDKSRETAKNYLKSFDPVFASNVVNLEFADVVENTTEFLQIVNSPNIKIHMDRWKNLNHFLYDTAFWAAIPVKRFFEAEFEVALKRDYRYS